MMAGLSFAAEIAPKWTRLASLAPQSFSASGCHGTASLRDGGVSIPSSRENPALRFATVLVAFVNGFAVGALQRRSQKATALRRVPSFGADLADVADVRGVGGPRVARHSCATVAGSATPGSKTQSAAQVLRSLRTPLRPCRGASAANHKRVVRLESPRSEPPSLPLVHAPDFLDLESPQPAPSVIAFVNRKAGGGQGEEVLQALRAKLSDSSICDLSDPLAKPMSLLRQAATQLTTAAGAGFRLLVAGGDGTVCSVLAMLEKLREAGELPNMPPVAVLPLGTGNDLSRVLGWGGGWAGESLAGVLRATQRASATMLDRWKATVAPVGAALSRPFVPAEAPHGKQEIDFCNYFGIGVDASIAKGFDDLRKRIPLLCKNRIVNKGIYLLFGVVELIRRSGAQLQEAITMRCDGVEYALRPSEQGVILCNIASYGGGAQLCQQEGDDVSHQDGKLDVVAIRGPWHLGAIKVGLARGRKICQASEVELTMRRSLPVQADGEPWNQPPTRIVVKAHSSQACLLQRNV